MSNIILFDFENKEIRFVGTAENPEWIAADICKALDLDDTSQAVSTLKPNEKGTSQVPDGSLTGSQMLTVNEKGLYRLIFKSRKPAAERMKDWVFSDVLPSIRKTGKYSIPEAPKSQQLLIEQSVKVAESIDRIQDILSKSNPRLAQILIDIGVNDFVESNQPKLAASPEFPEDRWHSIVSIAEKLGIKTNASTRVKLGNFVGKLGLERAREERLCNGEMREIWCYRNDKATQKAVQEWYEELAV